jgi:very-short-patch-repair endonuclease
MSYKAYNSYSDQQKRELIKELYLKDKKSFQDIADLLSTYPNKIRRDAIKMGIPIRDKSAAQSNALSSGKHKHPTKGTPRSDTTKHKIGLAVMSSWDNLSNKERKQRQENSKQLWNNLDEEEKKHRLSLAHQAVRDSSKQGSKLEKFLLEKLLSDGYKVDFHKEQILSNTKLQIDLFLPTMSIAIEVDGPSHFLPVWGEDTLQKNIEYDRKKNGLLIGKGLKLIRIKQTHDFSMARSQEVYLKLIGAIKEMTNNKIITNLDIED